MITDEELGRALLKAFGSYNGGSTPSWVAAARKARELLAPEAPKSALQPVVEVGSVWMNLGGFRPNQHHTIDSIGPDFAYNQYNSIMRLAADGRPYIPDGWVQVKPAPAKPKDPWNKVRIGQVWQWQGINPGTVEKVMSTMAFLAGGGSIGLEPDGSPAYSGWRLVYDPRDEEDA